MKNILNFSNVNCKHCYKCIRHCPVKAIKMEKDKAYIVEDLCIGCGGCFKVCPQDSKKIKSDLGQVKEYIKLGYKVVASLAPSFIADLEGIDYKKFITALKEIGFYKVEETIVGAKIVADMYKKYISNNKQKIYISSCCPTINYFITKYHGGISKYLIPVQSPMIAHGKYLKEKYGQDIKVVFIGPCISKKYEALDFENRGIIDKVLTFEECFNLIKELEIDINFLSESDFDNKPLGDICLFPIEEGIELDLDNINKIKVSGLDNVKDLIESINNNELENVFIEMNSCSGSCIGGIGFKNKKGIYYRQNKVKEYTKKRVLHETFLDEVREIYRNIDLNKKFEEEKLKFKDPQEYEIRDILISMGKKTVKDELNCGACGYDTCREKAIAVYRGLAEPHMCMPYMKDRVEALSNVIFEVTPNYIVIIGENFKIIDINNSMARVINKERKELIGEYIGDYIDISDFIDILCNKTSILSKKIKWKEFNKDIIGNMIYLKEHRAIIGIYSDITNEENQKKKFREVKINTINTAQNIIEKQMRVAQEIASLLGETTAETKVILTRLKELAMKGDEED
ncbi:[Fe-Fe] hydrogenase large subunit C-terminal domain-containing protein [Tepidibacter formicigenes]|uniref:Iron only hydrogenase large subunit, C-terminal domain n=1 Tax=Tepidibacter formicigenes DSM 15518 TaxID=1123349 RepID=A0A1M6KNS9_9FIRM|nr:[Fe-Fe] hydrogenase large subunit C-terminal domain-containing protein [Tepidibacter formicigenes]SHJ60532.1 Iron only hydrogenase large subunit, C-terminal domain [Tepidibacter formicigenes DSM 15518]